MSFDSLIDQLKLVRLSKGLIESYEDKGCDFIFINEADVSPEVIDRIEADVQKIPRNELMGHLITLHKKIASGNATTEDGVRYQAVKAFIYQVNKRRKGPNKIKPAFPTYTLRTLSDYKPMKNMADYTPKEFDKKKLQYAKGNSKLGKDTMIINMGSAFDCPSRKKGLCQVPAGKCYALRAEIQYQGDASSALRHRRMQGETWNCLSAEEIAEQIKRVGGIKYVRFNESGDFRSQADVEKISKVADLLKGFAVVYGYTARKDLNFKTKSNNLVINGSGFMVDNEFRFVPTDKIPTIPKGAPVCSGDCPNCDQCKVARHQVIYDREH
jgi:hypothetical protein